VSKITNGRKKGCGVCGESIYTNDDNQFTGFLPWNSFISTIHNEVPGTRNDTKVVSVSDHCLLTEEGV
jgi:polyferredoxin